MALSNIQKALEQYYLTKLDRNKFPLYYERRTAQYRDEEINKTKIITIPLQIKCISALFLNLPHEVSGQYGKVEKATRDFLFKGDSHLALLSSYYVSGLIWYKVERFFQNNEEGKKFRRARWHIMVIFKFFYCDKDDVNLLSSSRQEINRKTEKISEKLEKIILEKDEIVTTKLLEILRFITATLSTHSHKSIEELSKDRKLFEKKDTTLTLIEAVKKLRQENTP